MFLDTARRYASDVEVVKVVGEGFVEIVVGISVVTFFAWLALGGELSLVSLRL